MTIMQQENELKSNAILKRTTRKRKLFSVSLNDAGDRIRSLYDVMYRRNSRDANNNASYRRRIHDRTMPDVVVYN